MNHSQHGVRDAIVLAWAIWVAYTCFKRAIVPPKDNSAWWQRESHAVNKNPATRVLNIVAEILVLMIAFGLPSEK